MMDTFYNMRKLSFPRSFTFAQKVIGQKVQRIRSESGNLGLILTSLGLTDNYNYNYSVKSMVEHLPQYTVETGATQRVYYFNTFRISKYWDSITSQSPAVAMVSKLTEETISGYEAFKKRIEELKNEKKGQKIIVLFTGNKIEGGRDSWCPDCNVLERIFEPFKAKNQLEGHLLTVEVGNRDEWKSKLSPFRTDRLLRLTSIPTLMVWGTPKKLFGDAVLSEDTLTLLFNDDDY